MNDTEEIIVFLFGLSVTKIMVSCSVVEGEQSLLCGLFSVSLGVCPT